jgi:DNA-binding response OmpR family regulator
MRALSVQRQIGATHHFPRILIWSSPHRPITMCMRILLVEDEASQQEALALALAAYRYTVIPARDVPEALALLDETYDAVILDVRLPDPTGLNRDGLTLLGEFRARHPSVPVAVFTGIPLTQAEELFAASQNVTLLYKPQSLDRILEFLALHSAQPRATPVRVI